jgi:hypothetical protein
MSVDFLSFYDFLIGFWKDSDSVVFCSWKDSDSVVYPKCLPTRKSYNGMPLHVMEQPPRFFALAYRVSDACIYQ